MTQPEFIPPAKPIIGEEERIRIDKPLDASLLIGKEGMRPNQSEVSHPRIASH